MTRHTIVDPAKEIPCFDCRGNGFRSIYNGPAPFAWVEIKPEDLDKPIPIKQVPCPTCDGTGKISLEIKY